MFAEGSIRLFSAWIAGPVPVRTSAIAIARAAIIGIGFVIGNLPFAEMSGKRATILLSDCLSMAICSTLFQRGKKSSEKPLRRCLFSIVLSIFSFWFVLICVDWDLTTNIADNETFRRIYHNLINTSLQ